MSPADASASPLAPTSPQAPLPAPSVPSPFPAGGAGTSGSPAGPRVAGEAGQRDRVVDILVGAFQHDPTWSWVFPDPAARPVQLARVWRLAVDGAARYPWTWLDGAASAAAVWIPAGGTELSEEQESALAPLAVELLGDRADRLTRTFEEFAQVRPPGDGYFYLSLLGTDPARRGHGAGLRLLDQTLSRIDTAGSPAYLEASNPANVPLYARYGFRTRNKFRPGRDAPEVTTMWRDPARRSQARVR